MAFLDAFNRRRREPWDERTPSGVSAIHIGIPEWQRRQMGLDVPPDDWTTGGYVSGGAGPRPNLPRPNAISGMGGQGVALQEPQSSVVEESQTAGKSPFVEAFTRSRGNETRNRRELPRDVLGEDASVLRQLNNQGRTWRDKIVDFTDAMNTVAGGPKRVLPTKRERALLNAQQDFERDIEIQKQELNQMVPVTLEDGTTVMMPRRTAGTLQSNQQKIRLQKEAADERKRVNTARMTRWENMDKRDRHRLIADLYKSGGLNDPEMLEYAADQLGIPGTLREKFIAGQMRDAIDENGQLIQINRQNQQVFGTGQKGYETVKEEGRNRRFREGQAGADRRVGIQQAGADRRAALGQGEGAVKIDATTKREIAEGIAAIEQHQQELTDIDDRILKLNNAARGRKQTPEELKQITELGVERQKKVGKGRVIAKKLDALDPNNETGSGEGGYIYRKPRGGAAPTAAGAQSAGTGGSFNMKGWLKAHPNATEEEKAATRQRAKDRQLVIIE